MGGTMLRNLIVQMNQSQQFLWRTHPDGRRQVSWRVWLLIFVTPVLFLATAALLAYDSVSFVSRADRTTGEVVRVYEWEDWTPWAGNHTVYGPVFRYEFREGEMTEASLGQSSANWGFEIGSRHEILFNPETRGNVRLPLFEHLWALPLTILCIGLITLVPALFGAWRVRRWLRGGAGG
ncbi:DUF3592 domain-containing protein [Mameliella sp. AT18]|uniref:DUF3592 domain-containing protein n=1 Tax=Mameliella sp. AT18 TaxID=3028385 RepID=UPI0008410206|nr:DUF3592 domain-containing protein [Mameliella sp. AT18]MDD9732827.1 DUF3592 domain-containing protein [Mameliella sp. AT18]ODM48177.1 hypothetical protein A9320_20000 [Ruegeria sp. PBVC088]